MLPNANNLLGRLIRLPLRFIPKDREVRIRRGPLKGAWWIAGSHTHGCWLGTYERDKVEAFAEVVRPGHVVWDIGAHVGFYTLLASRRVGPLGKVYAFEPLRRNLIYLLDHVLNNDARNVKVFELAVGDREGTASFDDSTYNSHAMGRLSEGGRLQVEVIRLDDFAPREDLRPPSVIKMDVEGGEAAALRGMVETLRQYKPVIFLATHGPEVHRECVGFLQSLGYELTELGSSDELLCR